MEPEQPDPFSSLLEKLNTTLEGTIPVFNLIELIQILEKHGPGSKSELLIQIMIYEKENLKKKIPGTLLASVFECNPSLVSLARHGRLQRKVERKGSMLLSYQEEEELVTDLKLKLQDTRYIDNSIVKSSCSEMFSVTPGRKWFGCFFLRHSEDFEEKETEFLERGRMTVTKEEITKYKADLKTAIETTPARFIFTCDEVGIQTYCDGRKRHVWVRKEFDTPKFRIPVDRGEKRFSMLNILALSGESLPPLVLVPKPLRLEKFLEIGIVDKLHAHLVESPTGNMNTELFETWVENCFLPYLFQLRTAVESPHQKAVLIFDNCSCHFSERLQLTFLFGNIQALTYPPNSTHLLAPLDLGIFASLKQNFQSSRGLSCGLPIEKLCFHAISAAQTTCNVKNIQSAFHRAGIDSKLEGGEHVGKVDDAIFAAVEAQAEKDSENSKLDEKKEKRRKRATGFGLMQLSQSAEDSDEMEIE
jgi:hypothetical protein